MGCRSARYLVSLSALLFLAGASAEALGQQGRRHTLLVDDVVGGERQPSSGAETELLKLFMASGVPMVDEAQSRKIRSVTDAGRLLEGGVPEVITSLDADVIVAGVCRAERLQSDLVGKGVFRYEASLEAKAIEVETGRLLGVARSRGGALGFAKAGAATKACAEAARNVAQELLPLTKPAEGGLVEVTVEGIPSITVTARIQKGMKALQQVSSLKVLHAGRGMTKIGVELAAGSARDLALQIDGATELGLVVVGYGERAVRATWSPTAGLSMDLVAVPLRGQAGGGARGWRARTLSSVAATALADASFLTLRAGVDAVALPPRGTKRNRELKKRGLDPSRTLVLEGRHRVSEDKLHLELSLLAPGGQKVAGAASDCPATEPGACASAAGESLAVGLLDRLVSAKLLPRARVPKKAASAPGKPLRWASVEMPAIFPARLQSYAEGAEGRVKVKNAGREPIESLVLRAEIDGVTRAPVDVEVSELPAGAEREVSLRLLLDEAALRARDLTGPSVLKLSAEYVVDGLTVLDRRTRAVIVYDRNAMSWEEPASVCAFVQPRGTVARRVAAALNLSASKRPGEQALEEAAAAFTALRLLGLRYRVDPAHPYGAETLDFVRFPGQTVAGGGGDCDDLSVLFASLVEARGLSAMLILTPAHILPAVATGLPEEAALWVHGDPGRFVRHGGALWVPIEATRLEASFVEAWRAGAEHVQEALRRGEKVGFVAVREGWKRFPPAGLERAEGAELASLGGAEAAIARELRSLADERKKVAEREAADEGRSRGERALLYASMGRLEDARTLLRGKAGAARAPLEQLVNRGNLELVSGHPDRALSAYGEALRKAAGDARVHMNAGLAAWAKGDIEAFDEHILSCVENGGTDLVRRMSRILSGGAGTRAGAGDALRDLGARMAGALPSGAGGDRSGSAATRAGAAESNPTDTVVALLIWL